MRRAARRAGLGRRARPLGARCRAAFALGLSIVALGCAWLVSSEREVALGSDFAAEIEAQMGLAEASAASDWVAEVGARLARHASRRDVPYVFRVVDMPAPNAFALPGGFVYVSRGLLALVNDEAELAGVIGHEIGHVEARHSLRRATASTPFAIVFGIPSRIVGMVSGTLGGAIGGLGQVAEGALVAPYGRSQEHEADRIGQELAASAGYDPTGLSRLLESLEREHELAGGAEARFAFFATHPATPDRVARTLERAAGLERAPGEPIAASRGAVLERLDGLLVGANPAEGVFVGERFVHPDLGFELSFPFGWLAANGRAGVAAQPADDPESGLLLQIAAISDDPIGEAVDSGFGDDSVTRLEVNGLPAARLVATKRRSRIWITWIALEGRVYRLVGVAPEARAEDLQAAILAAHDSFRPLSPNARRAVAALRLRSRRPRAGEGLEAFAQRTGSAWSAAQIAVANGLPDVAGGDGVAPLKIAAREPYAAAE